MIKAVKRMSLSTLVLICFALGIITGLFFGEKVAWMEGIGNAFIKLLQMTIIPFIIVLFTPFKYRDVAGIAKDAIITAFAAGNIFIVLPILIQRTKDLYRKYNL